MRDTVCLVRGMRYGNFSYAGDPVETSPKSARKLPFKCSCGRACLVKVYNVSNGQKTCGHCNDVVLRNGDTYGSLSYDGPDIKIGRGSKRLIGFDCTCGTRKKYPIRLILSGKIKSCGGCSKILLKNDSSYHGFTYIGPTIETCPGSPRKLLFQCSCGKTGMRSVRTVTAGLAKTCGRCNEITLEHGQTYFDFVYVGESTSMTPGSKRKLPFRCRCGTVKDIQIGSITRRDATKCGSCHTPAELWYEKNREKIRELECPVSQEDFPPGGVVPLETIHGSRHSFEATCPACLETYRPYLHSIKRGISLTCGCTNNVVPRWNRQLAEFITSLGDDVTCEFVVDGMPYDIGVPEKKLLLELHGLRWHVGMESRRRDAKKFAAAKENGYGIIVLFEDEWAKKREIMKSIIASRLGRGESTGIRPSNCDIRTILARSAHDFYDRFHYIGGTPSTTHYGVFHTGELIGCMSFRKPMRQGCVSEHEISRMAMDPAYRVHGIWSKIMRMFTRSSDPKSLITFSDNRLFTGRTYEKMGFEIDGAVRPDYCWVKNGKRHHKSSLRKPRGHAGTENDLRVGQGYSKIWDYGKIRWKWRP